MDGLLELGDIVECDGIFGVLFRLLNNIEDVWRRDLTESAVSLKKGVLGTVEGRKYILIFKAEAREHTRGEGGDQPQTASCELQILHLINYNSAEHLRK